MDTDADNVAVRLAVAETHLIAETKKFLEDQGVYLDAFDSTSSQWTTDRSSTVMMVKNIPFDSEEGELRKLFGANGPLRKVVLPPVKTMALVEFEHEADAKKAFRSLAYKKYHHVPLYLEWAPANVMNNGVAVSGVSKTGNGSDAVSVASTNSTVTGNVTSSDTKNVKASSKVDSKTSEIVQDTDSGGVDDDEDTGTVFVKNINFDTTEDNLKAMFARCGRVRSITIAKKKNTKDDGKTWLSLGYGFVEFNRKQDALLAVSRLNNAELEGHILQVKLSNRKLANSNSVPKDNSIIKQKQKMQDYNEEELQDSNKLMVRNVPFEASVLEIKELFTTFGQVKRLRLPKKFDGTHRGFAFVDFVTSQEAKNAYKALQNTHLYGRHLVLEYGKADETVQELVQKSAKSAKSFKTIQQQQNDDL
jgi:multiple RNA-binding domain-containing protein 1